MINLDFSSVPDRKPLEEGIYDVFVDKVEETTAKTSGAPMLKVTFALADDPEYKLWENFTFGDKALFKIKDFLRACGHVIDENHQTISFEPEDVVGANLRVKIVQEPYNDQITNRIKSFMA